MKKEITIATHDGKFHADDVFAVATLELVIDATAKIIRTRDDEIIKNSDFVVDVGDIYDVNIKRFDHHQIGGAGERDNKIPYASFGLVWEEYGVELCGSLDVANSLDKKIVQPIDAEDNGIIVFEGLYEGVRPYTIDQIINSFIPSWREEDIEEAKAVKNSSPDTSSEAIRDDAFRQVVDIAKTILEREIKKTKDKKDSEFFIERAYKEAPDKKLIVLDFNYSAIGDVLSKYNEPLFIVTPAKTGDRWILLTVRDNYDTFKNRKDLPESWAGKRDNELAQITGVKDAIFCHNKKFIAAAKSQDGIMELARLALIA